MDDLLVKDPYGFIYITTNMKNGKKYIGQKKFDSGSRWKSYLGSGFHLMRAIEKYGKENFSREIIDYAYSEEELNAIEEAWIKKYNAVENNNFYNMVEGGKVQESLKKKNSIPVICIYNGYIFRSITDASKWSGYTTLTIKKSYKKMHILNNKNEKLIFRPITEVIEGCILCCICGENFIKRSNSNKKCNHCSKLKGKLIVDHDFNKSNKSNVEIYKFTDSWVINKIKLNDKRQSKVGNKKVFDRLEESKGQILYLYIQEKLPITNIVKEIKIPGLNNKTLEYALLNWGEKIRKRNKIY
ncbi:GIY-YIG nuclease family protein [Metabacillus sp. Hm71]|uniref:GIY-YIG nuclease family protein n=1 Tax=Metabacillus sp. Hm71 TaxID=3450743 RepID=UPI003F427B81